MLLFRAKIRILLILLHICGVVCGGCCRVRDQFDQSRLCRLLFVRVTMVVIVVVLWRHSYMLGRYHILSLIVLRGLDCMWWLTVLWLMHDSFGRHLLLRTYIKWNFSLDLSLEVLIKDTNFVVTLSLDVLSHLTLPLYVYINLTCRSLLLGLWGHATLSAFTRGCLLLCLKRLLGRGLPERLLVLLSLLLLLMRVEITRLLWICCRVKAVNVTGMGLLLLLLLEGLLLRAGLLHHVCCILEHLVRQIEWALLVNIIGLSALADVHIPEAEHLIASDFDLRLAIARIDSCSIRLLAITACSRRCLTVIK